MKDERKTKAELTKELVGMRRRVAELSTLGKEHKRAEKELKETLANLLPAARNLWLINCIYGHHEAKHAKNSDRSGQFLSVCIRISLDGLPAGARSGGGDPHRERDCHRGYRGRGPNTGGGG